MQALADVGPYKPFRPSSLKWNRSIDEYSDTAVITIPAVCHLGKDYNYNLVDTSAQFKEGMKVQIMAGYDGNLPVRFVGFIKRINYTVPVQLECEGYAYQMRKKLGITASFRKGTKLKEIIAFLIAGTDIKLSDQIPDVTVESPVYFQNASGIQAMDLIKDKMLLTIYFNWNVLYVGLRETEVKNRVRFRLGWNVVKDNELKFSEREFSDVRIVLQGKEKDGSVRQAVKDSKYTDTKLKKIRVLFEEKFMNQIAADYKKTLTNMGYEGSITAFMIPYAEPGMAAVIEDNRYPERNGTYFIEAVDGSFDTRGGRQRIKIGNVLNG